MKKRIFAALSALVIAAMLGACSVSDTVHVTVAKVKNDKNIENLSYDGTINASQTVNIIPNTIGKVETVSADIGSKVKAGDILVTLENTDSKLQLEQAQAGLNSAQSNYSKTVNAMTKQSETQMRQALERAENELRDAQNAYDSTKQQFDAGVTVMPSKAAYENAKADYDRVAWLVSIGEESQFSLDIAKNKMDTAMAQYKSAEIAAKTAMDSADSRLKNAKTAVKAAKENLSLTIQTVNPENIKSAEAQVDNAQATVNLAKKRLDDTVIKSPIDGLIASKNVKIGDMVTNQMPVMTVINPDTMEMIIHVSETYISEITRQFDNKTKVNVRVKDTGDIVLGLISAVSPSANTKNGLYDVKITIDNKSKNLKDGMSAVAEFSENNSGDMYYVPKKSVLEIDGNNYVYVLKEGKLMKTEVTIGSEKNRYIAVKGLAETDEVVVEGAEKVTENGRFRIISSGN